jgi:ribulose-5-phosphate 4-epimerase/fuculose-1-phosphate aldolase
MAVQLVAKRKSARDQVGAAECAARVELAAGHRLLAHYGVNDMTYNHFGLRVPGEPDHMLVKRTDWMFSEVTASSLLKVDFAGNEGFEFDHDMTPKLIRDLDGGFFMILRNHGVLVCGESVAECVVNQHWLEMACQGQIAALAAGEGNYTIPSKAACEYAHSQFMDAGNFLKGGKDWAACLRLAERLDPSYKD